MCDDFGFRDPRSQRCSQSPQPAPSVTPDPSGPVGPRSRNRLWLAIAAAVVVVAGVIVYLVVRPDSSSTTADSPTTPATTTGAAEPTGAPPTNADGLTALLTSPPDRPTQVTATASVGPLAGLNPPGDSNQGAKWTVVRTWAGSGGKSSGRLALSQFDTVEHAKAARTAAQAKMYAPSVTPVPVPGHPDAQYVVAPTGIITGTGRSGTIVIAIYCTGSRRRTCSRSSTPSSTGSADRHPSGAGPAADPDPSRRRRARWLALVALLVVLAGVGTYLLVRPTEPASAQELADLLDEPARPRQPDRDSHPAPDRCAAGA